jgi:hypothetical protein
MSENEKVNERKELIKTFFNTLRIGSVTDPDFYLEKVGNTREFTEQEILDHISGKKRFTGEELEQLKRSVKYNNFIL